MFLEFVTLLLASVTPLVAQVVLTPGTVATTVAGSGRDVAFASNAKAMTVPIASPNGIAVDASGNMYVADTRNHLVLRIAPTGTAALFAGNGQQGYFGDGSAAVQARLDSPSALAMAPNGSLLIADTHNHAIRSVSTTGVIRTVAGTGLPGYAGDDTAGTPIQLRSPRGLAVAKTGDIYISDSGNHRVRVLHTDGSITTVAGSGAQGHSGDGGSALLATLDGPGALAFTSDGRLLIADHTAVRVLSPDGTIATLSGTSNAGLRRVSGVAQDAAGNIIVADAGAQRLFAFSSDGTTILAGNGAQGMFTNGAPQQTALDSPAGVSVAQSGNVVFSDRRNHQIQRIGLPLLDFGQVSINSTAVAQTFTLTNTGPAAAQVIGLTLSQPFSAASGTCPTLPFALAAGKSCSMSIHLSASTAGTLSSSALVRVAGQAPQAMLLRAAVLPPNALMTTSTSLAANGSTVYAGMPVTFTATVHSGAGPSPSGSVSIYDGDFVIASPPLVSGTAKWSTSSLAAGEHQIRASYAGDTSFSASTSATVTETVAPQPDYSLGSATSTAAYSVAPGGSVLIPLTLQPVNGVLQGAVTFAASGLPAGATASFSPSPATLGSSPQTVTLTVRMPASSAWVGSGSAAAPLLACVLIVFLGSNRRRLAPKLMLVLVCITLAGCGSGGFLGGSSGSANGTGGGSGSPTGTLYHVVVSANTTGVTGQPLTHACTVSLVVTP